MRDLFRNQGRALLLLPWIGWLVGLVVSGALLDYVAGWHIYLQFLAQAILSFTFLGDILNNSLEATGYHGHGPECDPEDHSHSGPLSPTLVLATWSP